MVKVKSCQNKSSMRCPRLPEADDSLWLAYSDSLSWSWSELGERVLFHPELLWQWSVSCKVQSHPQQAQYLQEFICARFWFGIPKTVLGTSLFIFSQKGWACTCSCLHRHTEYMSSSWKTPGEKDDWPMRKRRWLRVRASVIGDSQCFCYWSAIDNSFSFAQHRVRNIQSVYSYNRVKKFLDWMNQSFTASCMICHPSLQIIVDLRIIQFFQIFFL